MIFENKEKESMKVLFTFMLGLILINCNAAESGFNAPLGSQIGFTSEQYTCNIGATGTPDSCVSCGLQLATVLVQVPIEALEEASGPTLQAGNKIQGVIVSEGPSLFVFQDGVETFVPQSSLVDPVAADSFPFVTNSRGLYTFAFQTGGCFDENGDAIPGNTFISADIGVTFGITAISIVGQ